MRKNVAEYFLSTATEQSGPVVLDKKFRTLSVDNFVRKWHALH